MTDNNSNKKNTLRFLCFFWKKHLILEEWIKKIDNVVGSVSVKKHTVQNLLKRFKEGDTGLEKKSRLGRLSVAYDEISLEANEQ